MLELPTCTHPIRWYHRVGAWFHERLERWHTVLPYWTCVAYDRIEFGLPCASCEALDGTGPDTPY